MTHGGDTVALGLAVGAGSMVLDLLGVRPDIVLVAAAACFLGGPLAKAAGSRIRAIGNWCAAVVVTCHVARAAAAALVWWEPQLAAHEGKAQALAAIVMGIAIHVLIARAPDILSGLLRRFKLDGGSTT